MQEHTHTKPLHNSSSRSNTTIFFHLPISMTARWYPRTLQISTIWSSALELCWRGSWWDVVPCIRLKPPKAQHATAHPTPSSRSSLQALTCEASPTSRHTNTKAKNYYYTYTNLQGKAGLPSASNSGRRGRRIWEWKEPPNSRRLSIGKGRER
jgi:hypothetical protein